MKRRHQIFQILLWIVKFLFKIFLILLYGALRLIELILSQLNKYLKSVIH